MPSLSTILSIGAIGFVALIIGMNLLALVRARRMVGKPAPAEVPREERPSLYYFMSPQCGACRAMTPVVQALAANDDHVHVVDVSRDTDLAMRFGILATPTTIRVRNGTVEKVEVGARSPAAIAALLQA
jgi:thioredoxin 1